MDELPAATALCRARVTMIFGYTHADDALWNLCAVVVLGTLVGILSRLSFIHKTWGGAC